eukprot:jgi/Mesen1/8255/ME000445S07402
MSTYGGDSWLPEIQLRGRRQEELFLSQVPKSEAIMTSSGKLACLVCPHRPVVDSAHMLHVHRQGRRHLAALDELRARERHLAEEVDKRVALGLLPASAAAAPLPPHSQKAAPDARGGHRKKRKKLDLEDSATPTPDPTYTPTPATMPTTTPGGSFCGGQDLGHIPVPPGGSCEIRVPAGTTSHVAASSGSTAEGWRGRPPATSEHALSHSAQGGATWDQYALPAWRPRSNGSGCLSVPPVPAPAPAPWTLARAEGAAATPHTTTTTTAAADATSATTSATSSSGSGGGGGGGGGSAGRGSGGGGGGSGGGGGIPGREGQQAEKTKVEKQEQGREQEQPQAEQEVHASERERARRRYELGLRAAGWRRDGLGSWFKEAGVEFDSDEETPDGTY